MRTEWWLEKTQALEARIKALETALTLIAATGPDVSTAELAEFARKTLEQAE